MAESARRDRRGVRPEAAALEGRMLLSRAAGGAPQFELAIHFAREHVSLQSGEVDVTLTRPSYWADRALPIRIQTSAEMFVDEVGHPGRTRHIRTTGRDVSALPFAPIAGIYKFAPGQTSLTIPIRLNPNYAATGRIDLMLVPRPVQARTPWPGSFLDIAPSPDRMPPEVVSSGLSPQAITLTFSKPMDPATVEDVNNYQITRYESAPAPPPAAVPIGTPPPPVNVPPPPVALKSAVYDAATRTVTLTPVEPLASGGYSYGVSLRTSFGSPAPPGVLTDLQGNGLGQGSSSGQVYLGELT